MPVLLILGPFFGLAAIAVLVARGGKTKAIPEAKTATPPQATKQFELDRGMPEAVVDPVLTALVHEENPAQLEALARELEVKYPIAASELRAKAAAIGAPPLSPGVRQRRGGSAGASPPAASPDKGEVAVILQAAMTAYAQERDPVELEGFAESIRAQYPTATVLLLRRAQALRAALPNAGEVQVSLTPPPPGSLAVPPSPPPPTKSATYAVHAGDTPSGIAERLTHDSKRWPELVTANPGKPTAADGTFVSLRPGETLDLPASWSAAPMARPLASAPPTEVHP